LTILSKRDNIWSMIILGNPNRDPEVRQAQKRQKRIDQGIKRISEDNRFNGRKTDFSTYTADQLEAAGKDHTRFAIGATAVATLAVAAGIGAAVDIATHDHYGQVAPENAMTSHPNLGHFTVRSDEMHHVAAHRDASGHLQLEPFVVPPGNPTQPAPSQ
jgi:hypothetical protein